MPPPTDRAQAHTHLVAAARRLARAVQVADRASPRRADTPPPLPGEPTQALRAAVASLLAAERQAGAEVDGAELVSRIVRSALWDDGGTLSAQTVTRVLLAARRAATASPPDADQAG